MILPVRSVPLAQAWERALKRAAPGVEVEEDLTDELAEKRRRCEESFRYFFEAMWPAIEPGTPLVMSKALEAMLEHLEAFFRGEIKRLLMNVPPGFSKSMATAVFGPAWLWGPLGQASKRVIGASYDGDLSTRDNMRSRDLMLSLEYQKLWGGRFHFRGDQNMKTRYTNSAGGWRQSTSVNANMTGHRGDFIVVDDPHSTKSADSLLQRKAALRWFTETLPTRINSLKDSGIVVIMQRLHINDISGHILRKDLGYEHLCIPMEYDRGHPHKSTRWTDWRTKQGELADPERFGRKELEDLKRTMRSDGGEYAVSGQLQQQPVPRGGGLFKREWFKVRPTTPKPGEIAAGPVRGWDLAGTDKETADWTAGVKVVRLHDGAIVVLDARREQLEAAGVYSFMRRVAVTDGIDTVHSVPQDPGQAGKDQKRHIAKNMAGFTLHFSPESGSKEVRASTFASQAEAGNVYLVAGDWNDDFLDELADFPLGAWDDLTDGASRAFSWLVARPEDEIPAAPRRFSR